jgi:hypothetical protein
MKHEILSQKQFILTEIVKIIREWLQQEKEGYSNCLELALSELVKENMRSLAQSDEPSYTRTGVLEQGLRIANQKIHRELSKNALRFELQPYWENIKEILKYPAQEMAELKNNFGELKELNILGKTSRLNPETSLPIEIREIGLQNNVEGLLALPLKDRFLIDIDRIKPLGIIQGEWFPFEIKIRDFLFTIDEDGRIWIFTENFPSRLILEVKETLKQLANLLYEVE